MLQSYLAHNEDNTLTSNFCSIQFQRAGTIKQITLVGKTNLEVDGSADFQVAFNRATEQFDPPTGVTGVLGMASISCRLTTSGIYNPTVNVAFPANQKVSVGDTIYLHCQRDGAQTIEAWLLVQVDE